MQGKVLNFVISKEIMSEPEIKGNITSGKFFDITTVHFSMDIILYCNVCFLIQISE